MTQTYVADLHNHTTASDGEYQPAELIQAAKNLNLTAIGVTDHDTLSGLDEALAAGEKLGIQVIPGVEVSLRFKRPFFVGTLHYLLYIPYALLTDTEFRHMADRHLQPGSWCRTRSRPCRRHQRSIWPQQHRSPARKRANR